MINYNNHSTQTIRQKRGALRGISEHKRDAVTENGGEKKFYTHTHTHI
jgi:hypothetical protein